MTKRRIRERLLQLALQPRNLAKSLSRMAGAGFQEPLVVTFDGHWLKLLQVEGPATARRIARPVAIRVEGKSAEEVDRAFAEACAAAGAAPHDVLVATPSHLSTIRLFSLPSTDPKEIRDIVELQAEKHTPYAKDEVLIDFSVLDRDRSGYSRVLLVIAHQDVVHRSVRLVEAAGLTLDRVGCELEGLIGWCRLIKRGARSGSSGASLVVDVDSGTTTLLVMDRGQPQFHRSLAMGLQQVREDPEHAGGRLVSELQRSIEAVELEGGTSKIQEILLTGRIERLGELQVLIGQGLSLPVHLSSPWAGHELSDGARAAYEQCPDVSFAGLAGLACSPNQIDLTPQATKLHVAFEARAKALVLLACQGVGALILTSLLIMGRAYKEQRYYALLRQRSVVSAQDAQHVEEALRKLEFVRTRLSARGQLLETVDALARLSPDGITWESVSFTEGEAVILKGVSTGLPKVYEFVAELEATPLFEQVEARRVAKGKSGEQDVTDFEIRCVLSSAPSEGS